MKLIPSSWKLRPATGRDFKNYSFFCACVAALSGFDLYRVAQWSRLHDLTDKVDSQNFCRALYLALPYGPPDLTSIPVLVIFLRIVLGCLFWSGSALIFASYSRRSEKAANCYRLVGFLFLVTTLLQMAVGPALEGRAGLFFAQSFSSTRETVTTLVLLSLITYALLPRPIAKHPRSHA